MLVLSMAIIGQTNKGSITGTVTDEKGSVVPGATVVITNVGTNQSVTLTTSDSGSFTANNLDPVTYDIKVEAPSFKKALVQKVKVDTASVSSVNVKLEVGNVAEQVTVSADTQTVNADSGTVSQTISERQLQDLPLNNRSVLDLAVTMPNVTGDAGSEDPSPTADQPVPGFNLSVNGGRPGSTSILADGVNNTGVGIARAVVSFTPETVQEFTVQSSAYSAEYGTTGGGIINVTTKSGTNRLSGTGLWYHRNPVTNARPWRQGTAARPANNLRYNQVSLSVGGPIFLPAFNEGGPYLYDGRNKSFFFFAYEPRWRTDFVSGTALVPTKAMLGGDFTNLVRTTSGIVPSDKTFGQASVNPTTIYQRYTLNNGKLVPIVLTNTTTFRFCQFGDPRAQPNATGQPQCLVTDAVDDKYNKIPDAFIDPVSRKLAAFGYEPGEYFLDNGLIRNYFLLRSVQQNETRYTLRLDHNFSDRFKTNFRYTKTPAVGIRSAGNDINGNTGVYSDAKQYLLTFNNIITSSLINDLRLNYTRGNFSEDFSPEFSIKTGRNFSSELGIPSLTSGGMPLLFLSQAGDGFTSADLGAGGSTNNFNVEQRFNISDILYWTQGNKSWKFGIDLSDARLNVTPFFAASGGRWQFRSSPTSSNFNATGAGGGNSYASFLLGVPQTVDYRPALYDYNYRWLGGAAFVQHDWKIRPNLTLNLGMRYSLQFPRTEKNNLQGTFRTDLAQTRTLTDAQRNAIAAAIVNGSNPAVSAASVLSLVPTTVTIPVFAFSGRGGRSRNLTPTDYSGWEPRFGFAYSPKMKIFGWDLEKYSMVIRGGYGISHAPINGNNRGANPDFGGFTSTGNVAAGTSTGGTDSTQPISFARNPPIQGAGSALDTLLGTTADGLVIDNSIAIPGIVQNGSDTGSGKVPYSQSWNLAVQFEMFKNTTVEIAYVGNRGVHLYTPQVNINLRNSNFVTSLESLGIDVSSTATIADPLGRKTLLGAPFNILRSSVGTPYFGFDLLNKFFDPSSNSIRHGAYIDVRRRIRNGLNVTFNYTYAKSIDDASDASPDVRVLSTGSVRGQVSVGGSRLGDRALSSYDVKHNTTATFTYDLPFGKQRQFLTRAPWYINGFIGGWTMSGVIRLPGGTPFQPFITDPNKLGGTLLQRAVRPDIVEGVALKNPLWDPGCKIGNACEPYINPAAFKRPAKGQLGNSPRTIDVRPPLQEYFDFSLSKDFPLPFIGGEGKRRINFRIDLINAFNHGNFRFSNTGNTPPGLYNPYPTELTTEAVGGVLQPITVAEYNTWAAFNGKPLATIGGAGSGNPNAPNGNDIIAQIRANVNAKRANNNGVLGALPDNFFSVPVPQGFATKDFRSYDITNVDQYKLYRLRQTYITDFGTLFAVNNPRYIQFGIRLFF